MKMIALVLSLCFTANVFAAAGSVQALERAFDSYNYAVTVEWDQKDPAFHQQQTKKLIEDIKALQLTKEELLAVIEKKVTNQQVLEAFKLKVSMLDTSSPEAISEAVRGTDMYAQGASWNGNVAVWIFPAIFVAVVVYMLATDVQHDCARWEYGFFCDAGDYMICGEGRHCVEWVERE